MTDILTTYFSIFTTYHLLMLVSFFICAIFIYALYSYLE